MPKCHASPAGWRAAATYSCGYVLLMRWRLAAPWPELWGFHSSQRVTKHPNQLCGPPSSASTEHFLVKLRWLSQSALRQPVHFKPATSFSARTGGQALPAGLLCLGRQTNINNLAQEFQVLLGSHACDAACAAERGWNPHNTPACMSDKVTIVIRNCKCSRTSLPHAKPR